MNFKMNLFRSVLSVTSIASVVINAILPITDSTNDPHADEQQIVTFQQAEKIQQDAQVAFDKRDWDKFVLELSSVRTKGLDGMLSYLRCFAGSEESTISKTMDLMMNRHLLNNPLELNSKYRIKSPIGLDLEQLTLDLYQVIFTGKNSKGYEFISIGSDHLHSSITEEDAPWIIASIADRSPMFKAYLAFCLWEYKERYSEKRPFQHYLTDSYFSDIRPFIAALKNLDSQTRNHQKSIQDQQKNEKLRFKHEEVVRLGFSLNKETDKNSELIKEMLKNARLDGKDEREKFARSFFYWFLTNEISPYSGRFNVDIKSDEFKKMFSDGFDFFSGSRSGYNADPFKFKASSDYADGIICSNYNTGACLTVLQSPDFRIPAASFCAKELAMTADLRKFNDAGSIERYLENVRVDPDAIQDATRDNMEKIFPAGLQREVKIQKSRDSINSQLMLKALTSAIKGDALAAAFLQANAAQAIKLFTSVNTCINGEYCPTKPTHTISDSGRIVLAIEDKKDNKPKFSSRDDRNTSEVVGDLLKTEKSHIAPGSSEAPIITTTTTIYSSELYTSLTKTTTENTTPEFKQFVSKLLEALPKNVTTEFSNLPDEKKKSTLDSVKRMEEGRGDLKDLVNLASKKENLQEILKPKTLGGMAEVLASDQATKGGELHNTLVELEKIAEKAPIMFKSGSEALLKTKASELPDKPSEFIAKLGVLNNPEVKEEIKTLVGDFVPGLASTYSGAIVSALNPSSYSAFMDVLLPEYTFLNLISTPFNFFKACWNAVFMRPYIRNYIDNDYDIKQKVNSLKEFVLTAEKNESSKT